MSLSKIRSGTDNWCACRQKIVASLRRSASLLRSSHIENATAEHDSARMSLLGDLFGLGGLVFAPLSGGLSFTFCGVSTLTGIGSYFNKRKANQKDDRIEKEVDNAVQQAIEEDRRASAELNELCLKLTYLEQQLEVMKIDDILISIQKTSITTLDINVREIEGGHLKSQLQQRSAPLSIPGLGISTKVANLKAAMTSAEEVVKITRVTREVFCRTTTIKQVVSTAKSVNQISKAANSLSTARQAASLSIQAEHTLSRSTSAFDILTRGTDGVVKTIAVVIKQASTTVKRVTLVAIDTEKAVRTTRITTNAARVTRVTGTATKAASISKVGIVINAVAIPLSIYNLVVASENLKKIHEDVQRIEDHAKALEQEMKRITADVNVQIQCFSELHVQLCKVYENHHTVVLYDYLKKMREKLGFTLPPLHREELTKCNVLKRSKMNSLLLTSAGLIVLSVMFLLFVSLTWQWHNDRPYGDFH